MRTSSALLALLLAVPASAQQAASGEKLRLSDAVRSLSFGGDLRLRQDSISRRGAGQTDRSRLRYRLRAGVEAELPDDLSVALRLGSGTGEQSSTNQSFDNLSSQKQLWIDLVYLRWKPAFASAAGLRLSAGRLLNPLWRPTELVWDEDVNPEGFAQSVEWKGAGGALFAHGLQGVADEDSNSGKNQWYFVGQAGGELALPAEHALRAAAAYHKWSDENRSSFSQAAVQDGNRRLPSGALANRFGIGELSAQLAGKAGTLPYALTATLARNLRARNDDSRVMGPAGRDAYQLGAALGSAKTAGTWELGYFKKYVQIDAVVADVAESDFGDSGGGNRSGHVLWLAWAPRDWMRLQAKGYVTDALDRSFPNTPVGATPNAGTNLDKAVNRLLLDVVVKF